MRHTEFIDSIRFGEEEDFDYVKMLDANPAMHQLRAFGRLIETEMREALLAERVAMPSTVHWSLWIGGKGSTTSMHVDSSNDFNALFVLRGAKRVVLVDPAFSYPCERPASQVGACWTGDTAPPPPPNTTSFT